MNRILSNRIVFQSKPSIQQFMICEGEGKVEIGNKCSFGYKLGGFHRGGSIEIQARYQNSRIKIGNDVWFNNNAFLCSANYIEVGDYTLVGQYVTIMDHEGHEIDPNKRRSIGKIGEVIIGKNVWIGNNVIILKNTIIGDNSIVAAGSIVSGSFESNIIIGGVPAKKIKNI